MITKTEWQSAIDRACLAIKRSIGRALALTGYREIWALVLQVSRKKYCQQRIGRRSMFTPGIRFMSTEQIYDQINTQSTHIQRLRLPSNKHDPDNTLIINSKLIESGWLLKSNQL